MSENEIWMDYVDSSVCKEEYIELKPYNFVGNGPDATFPVRRFGTSDEICISGCERCRICKKSHLTSECHPILQKGFKHEAYIVFTSLSSCVVFARNKTNFWTMYRLKNGSVEKGEYLIGKLYVDMIRLNGDDLEYIYYHGGDRCIYKCRSVVPKFTPHEKEVVKYGSDDSPVYQKLNTKNVLLYASLDRKLDKNFNIYMDKNFVFGDYEYEIRDHRLILPKHGILVHTFINDV